MDQDHQWKLLAYVSGDKKLLKNRLTLASLHSSDANCFTYSTHTTMQSSIHHHTLFIYNQRNKGRVTPLTCHKVCKYNTIILIIIIYYYYICIARNKNPQMRSMYNATKDRPSVCSLSDKKQLRDKNGKGTICGSGMVLLWAG